MMLQLYDYYRSSAAFRVRIALNYKGLPYRQHIINLLNNQQNSAEYQHLNPAGLVPTLLTAKGETLYQSLAIIEYLEQIAPHPALLPSDLVARAYIRSLALEIACDIHPLNNLRVLNYLKNTLNHSEEQVNLWYQHWITCGLTSLEQKISASSMYQGSYCFAEQFSLADLCLIPQLYNARRYNCSLEEFPTLCAIEQQCLKLEHVQQALPDKQKL